MRPDVLPIMQIQNNGHAMVSFLNGELVGKGAWIIADTNVDTLYLISKMDWQQMKLWSGFAHGKLDAKKFTQEKPVNLRPGINHISLLCMTLGIQVRPDITSQLHLQKCCVSTYKQARSLITTLFMYIEQRSSHGEEMDRTRQSCDQRPQHWNAWSHRQWLGARGTYIYLNSFNSLTTKHRRLFDACSLISKSYSTGKVAWLHKTLYFM